MALIRSVIQSSKNVLLFKFSPVTHKNLWDVHFVTIAKKVDIPSPPKRPLSAYMIFCKENRSEVLKEDPFLSSTQQIKKLAEKWSNLSVDLKKPYEISARESILLYGEAHKKYYENLTQEQKEQITRTKIMKRESRRLLKLKKALRENGKPRAPVPSSYALFIRSQSKDKSSYIQPTVFIKETAEKWRNLSIDTKKEFEEQAALDKKRYITEMKQWRKKMISEGQAKLLKEYDELIGKGKIDVEDSQSALLKEKKATVSGKGKAQKKLHDSKN